MLRQLFLVGALSTATGINAQVVNPGFEQWTLVNGVNEPVGWTTFNPLGSLFGYVFAEQGSPGVEGNSYLRMTAHQVDGVGFLSSMVVGGNAGAGRDGFPWSTRPATFNGRFRFDPQGADEGHVIVAFYRWDPATQMRVGLGGGFWSINEATTAWTDFSLPMNYYSPLQPDTVSISFVSGGGQPGQSGTVFDVDAISFNGTFVGVEENEAIPAIRLVIDQSAERLQWNGKEGQGKLIWRIVSAEGKEHLHGTGSAISGSIELHGLSAGGFIIQLLPQNGPPTALRFVKSTP